MLDKGSQWATTRVEDITFFMSPLKDPFMRFYLYAFRALLFQKL